MALVLDLLAETGEPLSHLVDRLPKFAMVKHQYPYNGPEGAEGVADLLGRISAAHPDASADRRDGLRLDWSDRWVHVRPSNTEPLIRLTLEGDTQEIRDEKLAAVEKVLRRFGDRAVGGH